MNANERGRQRSDEQPLNNARQRPGGPQAKPAVPLEEMVDRARAAHGEAAGDNLLSSAAKTPAATPEAPPAPPGPDHTTTADLLESDLPEGPPA